MNKVEGMVARLRHMLSPNRRRKATILVKERIALMASSRPFKNSALQSPIDLLEDPEPTIWVLREVCDVDVEFFNRTELPPIDDYIGDDGRVHTDHTYVIQTLYGGISYTNESSHRSVFNRHGQRIDNLSYVRLKSSVPSRLQLPTTRFVKGTTANLYGNVAVAEGNYFHWFVDALSRLFIIQRESSLDDIDYLLVPPLKYDFHWDSLAALGFDASRIIELQPLDCLQFECLLATSSPRGKRSSVLPGWMIDWYRETLMPGAESVKSVVGKRIYISRRDAPKRMFLNEQAVCDFFEARGFDVVELAPLDLWNKIAVFRDADVIVSQTGAGLTNLMFCRDTAKAVELVDERFVYPLYHTCASFRGMDYYIHYFSDKAALSQKNAIMANSTFDIVALEKNLLRLGL